MKAWAVMQPKAPLQCIDIADPVPTGTDVVLETTECGVCHSDLHFWEGEYNLGGGRVMRLADRGATLPRAMGHEIVGRVVGLGPDAEGVALGDLRIIYPWLGCGICERCIAGESNLCAKPASFGSVRNGGYGERIMVPHPRYLIDPGDLDPALAATYACSGLTVYSAIRKAMPLSLDSPIVLIGAGGLGLAAIAVLKALGYDRIISLDISAEKRAAAIEMGASEAIDAAGEGAIDRVRQATGGLVLAVLDFVNASETAKLGLNLLAKGGKLILVGYAGGELTISLAGLMFARRSIIASATGSLQELRELIELAQGGSIAAIPITRMPHSHVNEALELLHEGRVTGRIVLEPDWQPA